MTTDRAMTTVSHPKSDRFAPAPMASLLDAPVRYDLGESTCPALRLGDLLTPELRDRLAAMPIDYGPSLGHPELRALLAADTGVTAEDVLLTAGSSAALFLAAFVVCAPGEHAVVTTPCFPPARAGLDSLGLEVGAVPLSFDDGYRLDVPALAAALRPDTRLVSIASPQNPSGVRFTDAEIRSLLDAMAVRAPGAVLVVDENYRHSTYRGATAPGSVAALDPRVVTCASLSKAHGAAGLRVGWLTCTDAVLRARLARAKFTTLVCGSGVDEVLAIELLNQQDRILAARGEQLTVALDQLTDWAAAHADAVEFLPPDGGAMCCLRLRDADPAAFHAGLATRDTRVAPGSWFGESDRVFRLGFGHLPPPDFTAGLDRMAETLAAIRRN